MIQILATDSEWQTSPEEGDPRCLCSRCLRPIGEDEIALRGWPKGKDATTEYRYCESYQEAMGIQSFKDDESERR